MLDSMLEPDWDEAEGFMESHRERAINTIAMGLNTNICIDEVAKCIAYAYTEGQQYALNLIHNLFLRQTHIYAILEDEVNFWDAVKKEGYDHDYE